MVVGVRFNDLVDREDVDFMQRQKDKSKTIKFCIRFTRKLLGEGYDFQSNYNNVGYVATLFNTK